jgi:hypothetical protein
MIFSWTKQFLVATGLFALILTGQTINTLVKEKHISQKALENAPRSARLTSAAHLELN